MNALLKYILFFSLTLGALADYDFCPVNKRYIDKVYFDKNLIKPNIACEEGSRVNELLSLLRGLDIPLPRISIHLVPESDNAAYDNGTLITIPLKFYSAPSLEDGEKIYKSTSDLDAIILHEYGHAILASYLAVHWDNFTSYRNYGLEISKLKQELLLKDDLEKMNKLKALEKEFMLPRSMRNFSSKITPFQEFFADVISVAALNDKDAIYKAIVAKDLEEPRYLYRSFEIGIDFQKGTVPDSHGHFFVARQFIGSKYWDQLSADKNRSLKNILTATTKELMFSFYLSSFMSDHVSDNDYFIETLAEYLELSDK